MKKLLFLLSIICCLQSLGQKKKFAEKIYTNLSIDSFYVKVFPVSDSVFAYSNDAFVDFTPSYYTQRGLPLPPAFSNYHLGGDGIYRNSVPMISNMVLTSGTYTPTLTSVSNIQASTAFTCAWIRVGDLVTVTGQVSIDCTTASSTSTEIGISLPVVSNLIADASLAGTAVSDQVASLSARVKADAANDRARIVFKAISATNDTYSFTFTYLVQ